MNNLIGGEVVVVQKEIFGKMKRHNRVDVREFKYIANDRKDESTKCVVKAMNIMLSSSLVSSLDEFKIESKEV